MQTIYLDISNKGVTPRIYAKQSDVGRKFVAVMTDGGVPFEIPEDALISIWYEGASGSGNYTDIGNESAISVSKNLISVELIHQMLAVPGCGEITIVVNSTDGKQIGLWNIQYDVERVAGWGSESAKDYFSAFSNATENLVEASRLFLPDKTLTQKGRPAEAYEAGLRISALEGRVNELSSLPDGSTTGDAELADARVGYDGETYENVGEHIRDIGKLAHNTSFAAENLVGNIPILVSRQKDSDGGLARRYTTEMKLIGDAKYLDHIEVPVLIDRVGGYSGVHNSVVAVANGRISESEPIASQWLEIPDGESSATAIVNIGEWFLPEDTIIVSVLDASTSGILRYPSVSEYIKVDWLEDRTGEVAFPDGYGSEYPEVRFVGTATFYDTIKNDAKNYISYYKQTPTPEQQAQARENIDAVADEDLRKFAAPVVVSTNINDEVYVRGAIHDVNNEVDEYYQGYKNLNFIPVIGGKTIEAFGASNFQTQNLDIMEYDYKRKPIVKTVLYFRDSDTTEAKSLTLSESTCFIRFSKFSGIASEMSDAKIAIYYSEDATNEYIPHSLRSDEPLVDYTRVINSKINVKHIYSTVLSMTRSSDLKADDICETLGYYTENDGGGASYLITTSVDEKAHQETLSNGLYATLMPGDIINVKQLGAISHESIWYTPNDSFDVIQKAINIATRGVLIPEGIYKVSRTITVSNKNDFSIEAGNASINFEQTDENAYCIKCTGSNNLRFNLGVIRAATGGCLELYSADDSSHVQYIDVYFHSFQSDKNCVYVHGSGGWVSEARFYEGRVQSANSSEENTGFKIDGSTILIDHFSFQNIGFEGVRTGLHLIGPSKLDEGIKILECFNITNCRLLESLKTLIKTENYVRYINIITSCIVYAHYFDLSEKTGISKITGFCAEKGGACLATSATITDGIIIPDTHERWRYINSKAIVDLSTYEDAIDSATDGFIFGSAVEKLKLSNQYGREFGKNRFSVKLISKNENGFAIYDSSDCLICDGANMQSGDIIQFDWFFVQNDEIATGWLATKISTMPLLESAE